MTGENPLTLLSELKQRYGNISRMAWHDNLTIKVLQDDPQALQDFRRIRATLVLSYGEC